MPKMLKTIQIYQKHIFLDFCCFSLFLDFSKILSNRWVKNWVTTDAPLYNSYEAKLLNDFHSKLCKEKKRKMISLSWATCPF
jgi:hypothetical protein